MISWAPDSIATFNDQVFIRFRRFQLIMSHSEYFLPPGRIKSLENQIQILEGAVSPPRLAAAERELDLPDGINLESMYDMKRLKKLSQI